MTMKMKKWCERFPSNPWIFRQEEFSNANPSFRFLCEYICKVVTYYANPSSTYHTFAHDESR